MRNSRQRIVSILALVIAANIPRVGEAADGSTHPLLVMVLWLGAPLFVICAGLGAAVAVQAVFLLRASRERKRHARSRSSLADSANRKRATLRSVPSRGTP